MPLDNFAISFINTLFKKPKNPFLLYFFRILSHLLQNTFKMPKSDKTNGGNEPRNYCIYIYTVYTFVYMHQIKLIQL